MPLIRRLHPTLKAYRRNYINRDRTGLTAENWPDFDVITEACFDSWDDFETFCATSADPEIRRQVLADEANFVETARTRRLIVDEASAG